jgi:hypothetical protein
MVVKLTKPRRKENKHKEKKEKKMENQRKQKGEMVDDQTANQKVKSLKKGKKKKSPVQEQ